MPFFNHLMRRHQPRPPRRRRGADPGSLDHVTLRLRPMLAGVLLAGLATACGPGDPAAGDPTPVDRPGDDAPGDGIPKDTLLGDDESKASYSLGYRFAENVQRQFPEQIDSESFVRGVRDQLTGEDPLVEPDESERVLTAMVEERQAAQANAALENLETGLAFLEENAQREGVTATDSGLQYEVLEEGEGQKPEPTDRVTTHYEGRLIDGTVFDSSYERGEPATFPLNQVIPGWTQGLQLMTPGAKYRLYVPPDLAYGDRGAGTIPPNSTLIFDVELLEVHSQEGQAGGAEQPSGQQQSGETEQSGEEPQGDQ